MPVTWAVFPERSRAELTFIDPYTFTEFEDAMRAILATPALPQAFRILIDRRSAAPPTSSFVACVVNLFGAHEPRLAGTRGVVLLRKNVRAVLPDLRVGRFRIRTFDDAADAERWLHSDTDRPSMHLRAQRQQPGV